MVIPAASTEYVHVPVTVTPTVDLTGEPPRFAFLPATDRGSPEAGDWLDGEWDDGEARILVGPDGETSLTRGDWYVWISIDPPGVEDIVRLSGTLSVT
ncbi:hypothetical protein [Streptomyces sp. NPDC048272]|uniref:hypothetical protein n=1 Tax=Streptomyces sp. NPDC048272 TaxID=3154616 RepID=UPI00341A04D1